MQVVTVQEDDGVVKVHDHQSRFDSVLGPAVAQEDVFAQVASSVEGVFSGINATIFAYGQTGSGKTYTMLGEELETLISASETLEPSDGWGVIPRAIRHLFALAATLEEEGSTAEIRCSYMQIYNDRLFDLLQDARSQRPLEIRERPHKDESEVYVQGLSEVTCVGPARGCVAV